MAAPGITDILQEQSNVDKRADGYLRYFRDKNAKNNRELEDRRKDDKNYTADMVHRYYDLSTDFYEYAWGENFHFYGQSRGDSREVAIKKHHYRLAIRLNIQPGESVLDMGCGVGGPARSIAQLCECKITGININDYQLKRARYLTEKAGLSHLCQFQMADFINTGFESESFSKIFAIESTCHAADKTKVYGEAFRLLEKGGLFAFYEWLMTDKYNPNDEGHKKIKEGIMEGDGLPDIELPRDCRRALKEVGFEIVEARDLAPKCDIPWWYSLSPSWSIADFRSTPLGIWMTHLTIVTLETIGIAPKGSTKAHNTLRKAADCLVKGGKEEIFTPMYFVLARKPSNIKTA